MHRGYMPLWRKFFDHKFWSEKRVFSKAEAWIDILSQTQYEAEPKQRLINGQLVVQNYGEAILSTRYCAQRWGWHKTACRRYFILLEKMEQIEQKCVHNVNIITVINFKCYDIRVTTTVSTSEPPLCPQVNHLCVQTKEHKNIRTKEKELSAFSMQDVPVIEKEKEDFFLTKKKRRLAGKRLETFNRFWDAFDYKRGKTEAADAWIDIPSLTGSLVETIILKAKAEATGRTSLIQSGHTPKMAQGWLTARRWEDETETPKPAISLVSHSGMRPL